MPLVWPTPGLGSARRRGTSEAPRLTSRRSHRLAGMRCFTLAEIGLQCATLDVSLEALCRRAERLTVFAWIFRYPGDVQEPPVEEVAGALALAHEIYDAVLARVPAEARP